MLLSTPHNVFVFSFIPEWNIHVARESRLHAVYWVVYTIATVYSFIVTIVYWTFVYDPGKFHRASSVPLPHVEISDSKTWRGVRWHDDWI